MNASSRKTALWLLALSPLLIASKCNPPAPVAKASWEQVLASCGASDLQKSRPLYFGAANKNGVGSIWSVDSVTGDYWPTSQLADITKREGVVYPNSPVTCKGEVKNGIEFDVGIGAKPVIYPVSADIQAAISNAQTAKVSVDSIVEEDAVWDKFNEEFSKLPAESAIKQGVALNNRLVVGRAWKIRGFHAILTYKGDDAAKAAATLDAKAASGTLNFSVKKTSDNTLEISSTEDLYIAGVFRKLSSTGVAAARAVYVGDEVPAEKNAKVKPPEGGG